MSKITFIILLTLLGLQTGCQELGAPPDIKFNLVGVDNRAVETKLIGSTIAHGPLIAFGPVPRNSVSASEEHFDLTFVLDDPDNNINKVELYANGDLLSSDSSAPFSFNTSLLSSNKSYTLTPKVYDATGLTSSGPPISITVSIVAPGGSVAGMKKIPVRLGDRHYVGSVFESIFGSVQPNWNYTGKSSTVDVVQGLSFNNEIDNIYKDVTSFGGACDLNTRVKLKNTNFEEFRREKCSGTNFDNITNLRRDAKIMSTCEKLANDSTIMRNMISKVGGDISTPPTAQQTQAVFELFYPNLNYDNDLKSSLDKIMALKTGGSFQKWTALTSGICQTAYWQVID